MPLYEYHCEACGQDFEVRQRYDDSPLTVHEQCGGDLTKKMSVSSLVFKGSGFYATDYKKV